MAKLQFEVRVIEELFQMARKDRNRMKTLVDELIDARWALADMRDVCEPSVGRWDSIDGRGGMMGIGDRTDGTRDENAHGVKSL